MRKPKEMPEGALERLAMGLRQAKTKAEFQSVQCLWLRASLKLSADQVATAIGWHPNSVRKLQARYFKEGRGSAQKRRGRPLLSKPDHRRRTAVTPRILAESESGGILEVSRVRPAYEQACGSQGSQINSVSDVGAPWLAQGRSRPRHPNPMPSSRRLLKKLVEIVEQEVVRQGQRGRQLRLMFRMRHACWPI